MHKFKVTFYDAGNCDIFQTEAEGFYMDEALDAAEQAFYRAAIEDHKTMMAYKDKMKAEVERVLP